MFRHQSDDDQKLSEMSDEKYKKELAKFHLNNPNFI